MISTEAWDLEPQPLLHRHRTEGAVRGNAAMEREKAEGATDGVSLAWVGGATGQLGVSVRVETESMRLVTCN